MVLLFEFVCLLCFIHFLPLLCKDGMPFGLITEVETHCEVESLILGTKIADSFHTLDDSFTLEEKLNHRSFRSLFLDANHNNIPTASSRKNHVYDMLASIENKWIYFLGDETLGPIFSTLSSLAKDSPNCREDSKGVTIRDKDLKDYHPQICESKGFGSQGKLTFDKQNYLLENHDSDWFKKRFEDWIQGKSPTPDVIIIQAGYYFCNISFVKGDTNVDYVITTNAQRIRDFNSFISTTFEPIRSKTELILSTPPRMYESLNLEMNICTWKVNTLLSNHAHFNHIMVWYREEIENRFLNRLEYYFDDPFDAEGNRLSATGEHGYLNLVKDPLSHISTTSLVKMMDSYYKNETTLKALKLLYSLE